MCIDSLFKAAQIHDDEKGSFSTIYYQDLKFRIVRTMKYWNAQKRSGITELFDFTDQPETVSEMTLYVAVGGTSDRYEFMETDFIKTITSHLRDIERRYIYWYYLDCLTQGDIAAIENVSRQYVSSILNAAMKKIRAKYEALKEHER